MSFWHPSRIISKLSQIEIDVDKDWGAHEIKNLKAPSTDASAGRLAEIKKWAILLSTI